MIFERMGKLADTVKAYEKALASVKGAHPKLEKMLKEARRKLAQGGGN
ncbi:MAG: hypothetical protein ACYTHM_18125 [Planctomycetota bacterium]|jgi:phage shock protein A